MSDEQSDCILCGEKDIHRVPQMAFLKRSIQSKGDKVGDQTKAAIEENRAILESAKKDAAKDYYKDDN